MLQGLRLRKSQKAIFGVLFSLGLLIPVFDILRAVESLKAGTFSGVALWSSLEVTIAVIVASLPLYYVLLTHKGRQTLISHGDWSRHKDIGNILTVVETKSVSDGSSRPGKPPVNTFRDDLETQNLTSFDHVAQVRHFPPPQRHR